MHRIDVCPSSLTVQIRQDGTGLAEPSRALWLFEGTFPLPRYYLPRDDVRVPLVRGTLDTTCACNGRATPWTTRSDDLTLLDVAWSYQSPEHDAANFASLLSIYTERLDVSIDGEPVERMRTPWS